MVAQFVDSDHVDVTDWLHFEEEFKPRDQGSHAVLGDVALIDSKFEGILNLLS